MVSIFTIVKFTNVNVLKTKGYFMNRLALFLGLFLLYSNISYAESQNANQVVGSLPYSNQWEYEKADSYIFLVYDPQSFSSANIKHGDFNVSLSSTKTSLYGLNYYTRLTSLLSSGATELKQKDLALWLRFSLEFSNPGTTLSSDTAPLSSASDTGQLFMARAGAGPMLTWDLNSFIKPFLGVELWGYAYRHSASINSVDFSGQGMMLEPLLGIESRILAPVHAMAQLGFNRALSSSSSSILTNSTSVSFGLGAMF